MNTERYNRLDLTWLLFLTVTGSTLSAFLAEGIFDLSILLSGLLCVGLIAIGRREGYLIGLYNSLSYAILAYENGLYGEMYLNLFFFVPTGIIGYFMWRHHMASGKTVAMRQLSWTWRACITALCLISTVGLGLVLGLNPNQNTPF
ncbi:MAG: nicotinamide riboside transporter PnuC, partial [Candidatus Electrothrix sp. ATG1]|nr:nicotinamide riboside transporter PnuC [Candidatus Electrothrix sp. ATG1]